MAYNDFGLSVITPIGPGPDEAVATRRNLTNLTRLSAAFDSASVQWIVAMSGPDREDTSELRADGVETLVLDSLGQSRSGCFNQALAFARHSVVLELDLLNTLDPAATVALVQGMAEAGVEWGACRSETVDSLGRPTADPISLIDGVQGRGTYLDALRAHRRLPFRSGAAVALTDVVRDAGGHPDNPWFNNLGIDSAALWGWVTDHYQGLWYSRVALACDTRADVEPVFTDQALDALDSYAANRVKPAASL